MTVNPPEGWRPIVEGGPSSDEDEAGNAKEGSLHESDFALLVHDLTAQQLADPALQPSQEDPWAQILAAIMDDYFLSSATVYPRYPKWLPPMERPELIMRFWEGPATGKIRAMTRSEMTKFQQRNPKGWAEYLAHQ